MRGTFLAIGIACYVVFFATFLYLVAFVGNFPMLLWTVDKGPATSVEAALVLDLALIALFGVQHSVMARPHFKQRWTQIVPSALERSVYVLFASLMLIVLFIGWQPLVEPIWTVTSRVGTTILWTLFATGWAIVLASTFMISHFELFGLKQVWANLRGQADKAPRLTTPLFYRVVRYPLYSGFILAFWATPNMTLGHLVLAVGMTVYILIAIGHEERDLIAVFGDDYARYRARVGSLVPGIGRRRV